MTNAPSPADPLSLADRVACLSGASVLCLGDVMLDRFVQGDVDRVSPEAPIPVLRIGSETTMLGGAGNVARNLVGLGAQVRFLSVIGADEAGRMIERLLGDLADVRVDLETDAARPTTQKTRYLAGGQQLLRADAEATRDIAEPLAARLIATVRAALAEGLGALVLSDYGKGVLTDAVVAAVIGLAREADVPVIVDPKGTDYRRYAGAQVLTPNRKELSQASGSAAPPPPPRRRRGRDRRPPPDGNLRRRRHPGHPQPGRHVAGAGAWAGGASAHRSA